MKYKLVNHIKIHGPKEDICNICKKILSSARRLKKHIYKVHEDKEIKKNYNCNLCTKSFTTSIALDSHIKFIHEDGKKDFKCLHCKKIFSCAALETCFLFGGKFNFKSFGGFKKVNTCACGMAKL